MGSGRCRRTSQEVAPESPPVCASVNWAMVSIFVCRYHIHGLQTIIQTHCAVFRLVKSSAVDHWNFPVSSLAVQWTGSRDGRRMPWWLYQTTSWLTTISSAHHKLNRLLCRQWECSRSETCSWLPEHATNCTCFCRNRLQVCLILYTPLRPVWSY